MIRLKKAVALLLVAMMTITAFAGCAKKQVELDESAVLMTVGDRDVTVGMVNFYTRYQQSLMESVYESYLGEDVWTMEIEKGLTYEESTKEAIMEQLQELYIIAAYTDKYEVALTDDEKTMLETTAQEFEDANSKAAKEKASAVKEYANEYLQLVTIQNKMEDAMKMDIDTEVDDAEVAQKRLRYVVYSFTEDTSDDELKTLKKDAEACLKAAKENGSLEAYSTEAELTSQTVTFDADSTALDEAVIKAADALEANAFADVIEAEDGYYVVQLESTYDTEATSAEIETILDERGQERYDELLKEWKKEIKIKVNEELWEQISFDALKVNSIQPEVEETEETETTEEDTTESTDTTETTDSTESTDAAEGTETTDAAEGTETTEE